MLLFHMQENFLVLLSQTPYLVLAPRLKMTLSLLLACQGFQKIQSFFLNYLKLSRLLETHLGNIPFRALSVRRRLVCHRYPY